MKTYKYTIIRADGHIDRTRIPLFDPFEVARRLPHSLVFVRLPATHSVSTVNAGLVTGPCWTLVSHDEHYLVDAEPQTDAQGCAYWRQTAGQKAA